MNASVARDNLDGRWTATRSVKGGGLITLGHQDARELEAMCRRAERFMLVEGR